MLGGVLGGCFQWFDRGGAGRGNSLYASRVSVDSLWKVGRKRGWWTGVRGGDVGVFVAGLMVLNVVLEWQGEKAVDSGVVRSVLGVLRGESEVGLWNRGKEKEEVRGRQEETSGGSQSQSEMWEKVEKEE